MLLNRLIIIISFFIFSISFANEKEKVLFEIAGMPITTIDLNQRINYLKLFNLTSDKDLNSDLYINDLISIMIFNQFSLNNNIKTDSKIIEDYYNIIIKQFENNNAIKFNESIYSEKLSKEIIIKNIIYDLQRKNILEILLNEKENNIFNKSDQNNLIKTFDIKFNYFVIQNKYKDEFKKINNILNISNIEEIDEILIDNNIKFNFYNKNIYNLSVLDEVIKVNILNGVDKFIIYQDEYLLLGIINRTIKKNIDLKYSIFQIQYNSKKDLLDHNIHCDNINNIKKINKFHINKYENIEIEKLNINVIENLIERNDTVLIENNEKNYLLILCDIEYNYKLAENLSIQKNIQRKVDEIEIEFIQFKKKEYNFILY